MFSNFDAKPKIVIQERGEIELKGLGKQKTYLIYRKRENDTEESSTFCNNNSNENKNIQINKSLIKTHQERNEAFKKELSQNDQTQPPKCDKAKNSNKFNIEKRGEIELKGKGKQLTYLIDPA